jgi:hypothetical protein
MAVEMKKRYLALPLVIFAIMTQLTMQVAQAQIATAIRIVPEQTEKLSVGETFTVNVMVEYCVNVYAVQVDLHYDPDVLAVINILEGPFLKSFGQTLLVLNESTVIFDENTDLSYGRVYYVASLTGDNPGAYGSDVLFTVTFEVVSDGFTTLHFIEYPGGGSGVGTYFMKWNYEEIIPEIHDAYYGPNPPNLISPKSGEVKVEKVEPMPTIMLWAMVFTVFAIIFIRKKMHNET